MKILNLTLVVIVLLLIGCSKEKTIKKDCTKSILEKYNMIEYDGQEIGCKFFLELFQYQNKQFFLLGNHCADVISYPMDCEGNSLCTEGSKCEGFYKNAERIGIDE